MNLTIHQMHDATLNRIRFEWTARRCVFKFAGVPGFGEAFVVEFSGVTELLVPATEAWGQSSSVLEVVDHGAGHYEFAMQSGDIIRIVALNFSFKPTPSARPN